jgi:hypothetical protein
MTGRAKNWILGYPSEIIDFLKNANLGYIDGVKLQDKLVPFSKKKLFYGPQEYGPDYGFCMELPMRNL